MYTSKCFHPKESVKFVSVGDPYDKKIQRDSRYKGRQFQTKATPTHNLSDYFSNFKYPKGEAYHDRHSYLESQPLEKRKLGFGSHDAAKKGEFSLSCRTEQWREHLRKERRLEKMAQEKAKRAAAQAKAERRQKRKEKREKRKEEGAAAEGDLSDDDTESTCSSTATDASLSSAFSAMSLSRDSNEDSEFFQCRVPRLLYDIGRTKRGTTQECSKCARDTFFCRHRAKGSHRYDPAKQESSNIGAAMRPRPASWDEEDLDDDDCETRRSGGHRHRERARAKSSIGHRPSHQKRSQSRPALSRPKTAARGGQLSPASMARVLRKPEFGRRSAVRDFYDCNHLHCN